MKNQSYANTLGQNRIDYIVYHNAKKVSQLLEDHGFEIPNNPKHLAQAIKELARKKGRKVIQELLQLHPDKDAILLTNTAETTAYCDAYGSKASTTEQHHCSSCGHSKYIGVGTEDSFLSQFSGYTTPELERYYQRIVQRSNATPSDKNLAQEVQLIWNEIRTRKQSDNKQNESKPSTTKGFTITKEELIRFGIVFMVGVLVGRSLKFNVSNVN